MDADVPEPSAEEDADRTDDGGSPPPEGTDPDAVEPDERQVELDEARHRIGELEESLSKFTEALARSQADFENFRKRARRERDEAATAAQVELLRPMVAVLDDLVRAREAAEGGSPVDQGLTMVQRKLEAALADLGVVKLEPGTGDAFQPDAHEALVTEPNDEHPPGTVLETLQPGYVLGERMVRPAMVKVAARSED